MARRLIQTINENVKIYRDAEWDEFVVQTTYADGTKSDYHTDDKEDAILTALVIAADFVQG